MMVYNSVVMLVYQSVVMKVAKSVASMEHLWVKRTVVMMVNQLGLLQVVH